MISLAKLRPYTGDVVAPSPNHGARKAEAIEGIVLHATADAGDEARSLSWRRSRESRASCHLLVGRDGRVTRLVGDRQRALHAPDARWRGRRDVNSVTLGIEIANRNDGEPYTDAQYARVAAVVAHYCRQGLSLDDVVSHGEIAAGREPDPREWDWDRFRAMVQHQLRPADVEEQSRLVYDRRSAERRAADEAAGYGSTDLPPPAVTVPAAPAGEPRSAATPKPMLCSRTLWVNGLTVLAAGSVIVSETLDLAFSVGLTVPEEITMWALFGVGVVNIILRFQTTCPIGSSQGIDRSPLEARIRVRGRAPGYEPGEVVAGPR